MSQVFSSQGEFLKCMHVTNLTMNRPETEAYTTYLASKICNGLLDEHFQALLKREAFVRRQNPAARRLKILDACSGSGCISLLLHNLLYQSDRLRPFETLQIDGMDISEKALKLSKENLIHNVAQEHLKPEASSQVSFMKYNILKDRHGRGIFAPHDHNIIISNPPYISRQEYDTQIPRSVRDWEPELALVPSFSSGSAQHCDVDPADIFYKVLMEMYQNNGRKRSFMLVMEVGDEAQAKRVLGVALKKYAMDKSNAVSVWRDSPDVRPSGDDLVVEGRTIPSEGQGNVRTVVFVRTFEAVDTKVKPKEDWRFTKKESWKHHRGSKKRQASRDGNDTINKGRSNILRSEYTRVKGTRQLKTIHKKPDSESRMACSFKDKSADGITTRYSSSSPDTPEIKP